jgi:iron complex transport system substrate-binding protein
MHRFASFQGNFSPRLWRGGMIVAFMLKILTCASADPHRIVSLNMCSDELVLRLADPANVASVTWLSRNARYSNVADLADTVPINHGSAEEVLASRPDTIIAGKHTTRVTVAMLRQAGLAVTDLDVPHNVAEIREEIARVAAQVGKPERGQRLIDDMDLQLAALPLPATGRHLKALVYNPNGFAVGHGTLVDEILTRAGLDNVAADLGIESYGRIPLETVVLGGVDLLILGIDEGQPPALATEMLHHPILEELKDRVHIVNLPSRLWTCGGPRVIEAIRRLIDARLSLDGSKR